MPLLSNMKSCAGLRSLGSSSVVRKIQKSRATPLAWGTHTSWGTLFLFFKQVYFESKRTDALKLAKVANWFSVLEEHEFMLVDQGTEALTG